MVHFLRENIRIENKNNSTVLELATDNNINLGICACGFSKCGKCKIIVSKGNDYKYCTTENEILTQEEKNRNIRLACCYRPVEDVTIITIKDVHSENKKQNVNYYMKNNTELLAVIDIGTTTIKVYIYSTDGILQGKIQRENPLTQIGKDVISRIAYATNKEKLLHMRHLVVSQCENMITALCDMKNIKRVAFVGNTTMMHIMSGRDVSGLGRYPFVTGYEGGELLEDLWDIPVYIPPFIARHVGADAYCVIKSLNNVKENCYIMVDVGTNTEIVLVKGDKIWCCSTPAGPAFEMVSSNMNASDVVNVMSYMLKENYVDSYGTLNTNKNQEKKLLSQEEIRNIQLAKSATFAAIKTVINVADITFDELEKVYIAGNFGMNININNAIYIGLLPDIDTEKYVLCEDAVAKGALTILLEDINIEEEKMLVKDVVHVELSDDDFFKAEYIKELNFK